MKQKTIVVALGGNAISRKGEEGNVHEQFANARRSLEGVIEMVRQGYRVLLTHGNGPQVGDYLIRVEQGSTMVPTIPLGVIVADTQGGMGYMLEQCLFNKLRDADLPHEVASLVTQVLVDKRDPALKKPSKFVGSFYDAEKAEQLRQERGWIIKEDRGRGFRRVVPSPKPKKILAGRSIKLLVDNGVIVIAAGGGGIPVYYEANGWLEGIDAVIDKDYASAVLAREVSADEFIIITGVEKVAIRYGTEQQENLDRLTIADARDLLEAGEFPEGSMGPKIRAAIQFLEQGGKRVVITSIAKSAQAVFGRAGTEIVRD